MEISLLIGLIWYFLCVYYVLFLFLKRFMNNGVDFFTKFLVSFSDCE